MARRLTHTNYHHIISTLFRSIEWTKQKDTRGYPYPGYPPAASFYWLREQTRTQHRDVRALCDWCVGFYEHWSLLRRVFGLESLSEKTWKSNHLHYFLFSWFKTLSGGLSGVGTHDLPHGGPILNQRSHRRSTITFLIIINYHIPYVIPHFLALTLALIWPQQWRNLTSENNSKPFFFTSSTFLQRERKVFSISLKSSTPPPGLNILTVRWSPRVFRPLQIFIADLTAWWSQIV